MTLRKVESESDWEKVRGAFSAIPMTSSRPLVLYRTSSLERSYPHLGGENQIFAFYDQDQPVGLVRAWIQERMVNGQAARLMYVGDLRVSPQHRGQGISQALMNALHDYCSAHQVSQAYYLVNAKNEAVKQIFVAESSKAQIDSSKKQLQEKSQHQRGVNLDFQTASFPIYKAFIGQDLFKEFEPTFREVQSNTSWIMNENQWKQFRGRYPEIKFFRRATDPRGIEFAFWRQTDFRRLKILSYPAYLTAIKLAWNGTRKLSGAVPFPEAKEDWIQGEICFVNPALKIDGSILEEMRAIAFQEKCLMMNVISRSGDKWYIPDNLLRLAFKTDSSLVPFGLNGGMAPVMNNHSFNGLCPIDLGFI